MGLNSVIYIFASLYEGFTFKRKNLLLLEQILLFKRNPSLDRLRQLGKQTGNHESCSPFVIMMENMELNRVTRKWADSPYGIHAIPFPFKT